MSSAEPLPKRKFVVGQLRNVAQVVSGGELKYRVEVSNGSACYAMASWWTIKSDFTSQADAEALVLQLQNSPEALTQELIRVGLPAVFPVKQIRVAQYEKMTADQAFELRLKEVKDSIPCCQMK